MTAKELIERYEAGERDFRGADLGGAYLYEANLYGANLSRAGLSRAELSEADLSEAGLSRTDLSEADLSEANLSRAYLYGANLYGANLSRASLYGANLRGAKNIFTFGPMPTSGRMLYAVRHESGFMVQAGCFWGTVEELEKAVKDDHNDPTYLAFIQLLKSIQ